MRRRWMPWWVVGLVVLCVLTVATLAGCGGGDDHGSTASLPSLATEIGCTFVEDTDEHELYTSDEGTCGTSTLYLFGSAKTRDAWLRIADEFGGAVLVGPDWIIADDDPAKLVADYAKVGGTIRR